MIFAPMPTAAMTVVSIVSPIQRIHTCPLELKSHSKKLCPLHAEMDRAYSQIEQAFGRVTLGELLRDSDAPTPLCDVQPKK